MRQLQQRLQNELTYYADNAVNQISSATIALDRLFDGDGQGFDYMLESAQRSMSSLSIGVSEEVRQGVKELKSTARRVVSMSWTGQANISYLPIGQP